VCLGGAALFQLLLVDTGREDLRAVGSRGALFAEIEALIDGRGVGGLVRRDPPLQVEHLLVVEAPGSGAVREERGKRRSTRCRD
jgi:hypothetical protein